MIFVTVAHGYLICTCHASGGTWLLNMQPGSSAPQIMPIYLISLILAVQSCQDPTSDPSGVWKAPAWISGPFCAAWSAWGHRGATEKIHRVPLKRNPMDLLCSPPVAPGALGGIP